MLIFPILWEISISIKSYENAIMRYGEDSPKI